MKRTLTEIRETLLERRNTDGHWRGRLSSSALSTAVASFALTLVARERGALPDATRQRVRRGLSWLATHANADGGWGDTVRSASNLPTTLLSWAALEAGKADGLDGGDIEPASERAAGWILRRAGDLDPESLKRVVEDLYGDDKTFSVPILTLAALAGVLGPEPDAWRGPPSLPFELAALPQSTFRFVGLPVVSYALPALIAVGQVQHHRRPSKNPLLRALRQHLRPATLARLRAIQPGSGGYLEAIPLTGFVTLSLAGAGEAWHPVVESALDFLHHSAREDGAWPIDIDLATWVTTLSIQGLSEAADPSLPGLSPADRQNLLDWLLAQQYQDVHPFTGAAPGGWAWTDLPGGVPDADDTPGALLALRNLAPIDPRLCRAAEKGVGWLADLQNRDGGLPTFCRGWGKLPFDRSAPDLTAHALRAFTAWSEDLPTTPDRTVRRALAYLRREQRDDGSWVPLWFGHEDAPNFENKVFGTARVLRSLVDLPRSMQGTLTGPGRDYLLAVQNPDGGWGGGAGLASSAEETALAIDALVRLPPSDRLGRAVDGGVRWLCEAWRSTAFKNATPIGFYFANLWYFEDLYPLAFTASALGKVYSRRATAGRP